MQYDEVFSILREAVADMMNIDEDAVESDSLLEEDLGMDSVDAQELMYIAEEEFNIFVKENDVFKIKSLDDAVNYVLSKMK